MTTEAAELLRSRTIARCCLFASVTRRERVVFQNPPSKTPLKANLRFKECTECGSRSARGFVEANQRSVRNALARHRFNPVATSTRQRD